MQQKKEFVQRGTFNAQRFFDTLALILSQKNNVKITVTVHRDGEQQPERVAV